MPETFQDNPIVEIQICAFDASDNGFHERKKEGDIITARKAIGRLGTKERAESIWIRMQGWDSSVWATLQESIENGDKRRYCVPLDNLVVVRPDFDLVKIRDTSLEYQPDMVIDPDTGNALLGGPIMDPDGLIFDKTIQDYI